MNVYHPMNVRSHSSVVNKSSTLLNAGVCALTHTHSHALVNEEVASLRTHTLEHTLNVFAFSEVSQRIRGGEGGSRNGEDVGAGGGADCTQAGVHDISEKSVRLDVMCTCVVGFFCG